MQFLITPLHALYKHLHPRITPPLVNTQLAQFCKGAKSLPFWKYAQRSSCVWIRRWARPLPGSPWRPVFFEICSSAAIRTCALLCISTISLVCLFAILSTYLGHFVFKLRAYNSVFEKALILIDPNLHVINMQTAFMFHLTIKKTRMISLNQGFFIDSIVAYPDPACHFDEDSDPDPSCY